MKVEIELEELCELKKSAGPGYVIVEYKGTKTRLRSGSTIKVDSYEDFKESFLRAASGVYAFIPTIEHIAKERDWWRTRAIRRERDLHDMKRLTDKFDHGELYDDARSAGYEVPE